MADDKLVLELVLDRKDVEQGFIKVEQTAIKSAKKASEGMDQSVEKSFGLLKNKFALAAAGIAATAYGIKKTFDLALKGEAIEQLSNQFDNLSRRAGVAGEALQAGLRAASDGQVGATDLMRAANDALIKLEGSAAKFPQLMAAARSAAIAFGGDAVQNFELITNAIASGQTRQLKQIGLFIDQTEALKKYAQGLGVTVDALTQAGRQQAILNAVLEKSSSAYEGIKDVSNLSTAYNQFKASLQGVYDWFTKLLNKLVSPLFTSALQALTNGLDAVKTRLDAAFGNDSEKTAANLSILRGKISDVTAEIEGLKRATPNLDNGFGRDIPKRMAEAQGALAKYRSELERIEAAEERRMMQAMKNDAARPKDKPSEVDSKIVDAAKLRADQMMQQFRQSQLAAREALANQMQDTDAKVATLDKIAAEKRILLEQEKLLKLRELQANETLAVKQKAAAQISIEEEYAARVGAIQDETAKRHAENAKKIEERQKQMNAVFENGFKNIMVNSITGFVNALIMGGKSMENFAYQVMDMFGDLAIQLGSFMIVGGQGLGRLFAGDPFGSVAFGAALIGVGAVLKGFANAGRARAASGGVGGTSMASAGVSAMPSSGVSAVTDLPETEDRKPATTVQINVQGNILDRRESGLAIAEVLNEYFNASDGRLVVT
jgi:hypothetical protein